MLLRLRDRHAELSPRRPTPPPRLAGRSPPTAERSQAGGAVDEAPTILSMYEPLAASVDGVQPRGRLSLQAQPGGARAGTGGFAPDRRPQRAGRYGRAGWRR